MLSPAVSCENESYDMNGPSTRLLTVVNSYTCASAMYCNLFEGSIYFAHTVVKNSHHMLAKLICPSLSQPTFFPPFPLHTTSLPLNVHSPLLLCLIHKHPNRIVLIVLARQRRCVCFVSSQNTRWRREL